MPGQRPGGPCPKQRILESRQVVDMLVDEAAVVYGITTGFGKFSDVTITQDECRQLQRNLIVTHAVGAGDPFPRDVARGIMLLLGLVISVIGAIWWCILLFG